MGIMPDRLTRPNVGLIPTTPHVWAGQMIDPSVSVPIEIGHRPAATAAAEPELEPQGDRRWSCGLRVCPPQAAPPADGPRSSKIGPLGQVGLSKNDSARLSHPGYEECILLWNAVFQGKRSGRGRHAIGGVDVGLQYDGDSMQRTADATV